MATGAISPTSIRRNEDGTDRSAVRGEDFRPGNLYGVSLGVPHQMNVVIGGASGIGAAVVRVLPGRTLVADRVGGDAYCDLTDPESLSALFARVDRLDALVVTAGVSPAMADARTIFDVDLAGMARVLAGLDGLVTSGTVAVCVASMAGHLGTWSDEILRALDDPLGTPDAGLTSDSGTAYMLAKLGVIRLVKRTALEWGPRGARILSVSPGVINTPMGKLELADTAGTSEIAHGSAVGRMGNAEEVAAVISFLCSDGASFMTGTDVLVDGGAVTSIV
jgi:NAD(P)-dependent dehydrogenase (short-subunit alcohol dehydrogenase family)